MYENRNEISRVFMILIYNIFRLGQYVHFRNTNTYTCIIHTRMFMVTQVIQSKLNIQ